MLRINLPKKLRLSSFKDMESRGIALTSASPFICICPLSRSSSVPFLCELGSMRVSRRTRTRTIRIICKFFLIPLICGILLLQHASGTIGKKQMFYFLLLLAAAAAISWFLFKIQCNAMQYNGIKELTIIIYFEVID